MNGATVMGAVVGGALGAWASSRQTKSVPMIALGAIGAAITVGWLVTPSKALAAAPPSPSPAPSPPSPVPQPHSASFITLVPNQSGQGYGNPSEGAKIGDTVSIWLPDGAQWADPATGMPNGGTAPIAWTYQGPGVVQFVWQDPSGRLQRTTMTFYTVS